MDNYYPNSLFILNKDSSKIISLIKKNININSCNIVS